MMPYIFLWAGFVLNGLPISHMTNGLIERMQGIYKFKKSARPPAPHRHIGDNWPYVEGKCKAYLVNKVPKKKPVAHPEQPPATHHDPGPFDVEASTWGKKGERPHTGMLDKVNNLATYQNRVNVDQLNKLAAAATASAPTSSSAVNKPASKPAKPSKALVRVNSKKAASSDIKVLGETIYKKELSALTSRARGEDAWLSDSIIDALLHLSNHSGALVLSATAAFNVFHSRKTDNYCPDLSVYHHVVAAVCVRGDYTVKSAKKTAQNPGANHWNAVYINMQSRQFFWLDPRYAHSGINTKFDEYARDRFNAWRAFALDRDIADNWTFEYIAHTVSDPRDITNCGVYCVKFLQVLLSLSLNLIFPNTEADLFSYRDTMHDQLISNST